MAVTIYKKDGSERKVTWKAGEATGNGSIVVSGEVLTSAGRWAKPELEYSGTWMGETFVTLNISCAVPIDFEIGDYIIYRNEKFVINYDPTVIKKARRGTHGDGFVYDSVKFNSLSNELTDVRMLDYVIDDNGVHYSGLPKFSFFCDTVDALADRLQVNLNRYCDQNGITGNDRWLLVSPSQSKTHVRATSAGISTLYADEIWAQYYGGEDEDIRTAYQEEKVNQNVSIDNNSVWDAMKYIKDTFGLNFVISGRVVAIGTAGLPTDVFSYGKGNGLYEIERVADSDQQIVTKLYCYGSDKNLPPRYYANIGMQCWSMIWTEEYGGEPIYCIYAEATSNIFKKPVTLSNPSIYFPPEVANLENAKVFEITFTYSGQVFQGYITDASVVNTEGVDLTGFSLLFGGDIPIFSRSDTITITNGIDKDKWPSHLRTSSSQLPNNMAVNVLMLPGFPNNSLYTWVTEHGGTAVEDAHNSDSIGRATWSPRQGVSYEAYFSKDNKQPYILSKNFTKLGIREATKYFDGSDSDEEIYPTIKNTGKDVIVQAQKVTDNGVFADGEEVSKFEVILPDFGEDFPLSGLLQNDTAIEMTDGYCGGRTFTIDSAEQLGNGNWKCTCNREEDMDLWFPYSDRASRGQEAIEDEAFQVRGADIAGYSGDHYVLTGIEMTDTYVNAAAVTLLEAALNFLERNDYTRYTFSPKIDELFMARQHDGVESGDTALYGNRSYYLTLKEGDVMLFDDEDLDVGGSVYIDTLQIKEYGNGRIPTYEVTLRNDKQVGTIQRMQEQLNSLTSGGGGGVYGGGGGGGSVNIPQIRQLIQSYGKELFLSKVANDAAKGVITFLNGLQAGAEGAWGWVKETYTNLSGGVAWFKNLLADYLQPTIVKVMNYLTGNGGSLIIHGDVFVTADPENNKSGDLNLAGDLNAENANIRNMLTTNNLTVTGLAHFFELIIDKIKAAGGAQLFTPADGFKVEDVTDTTINNTACKMLWWRATDGDRETTNMWEVGDQAICMNFNLTRERDGEVMRDVENKNFWALVAEKDDNPVLHTYGSSSSSSSSSSDEEDTVLSHYITIYTGSSTTDSAEPLNPRWINNAYKVAIGDEIAMLGHRFTDADYENGVLKEEAKARQSAVYISAYASYDTGNGDDLGPLQPPFLAFYKGIDDFNLGSHRGTYMDAKGSRFVGKFISSSTSQDIENMLRGSEFDIIYGVGNPNTVSHPHYAWNQEAGEYLSHVGWLYFDIDLEPATEGGRLWRWSYINSDSSSSSSDEPYFTWVNINDVDSLAALDKIRDVASDGKLSGGAEKTRVYLEWIDAKKTAQSLLAQAEENGLDDADDPETDLYNGTDTYANAYIGVTDTFKALSTYLNDGVTFLINTAGVPKWIDPNDAYYGIGVTTELTVPHSASSSSDDGMTGAEYYRKMWSEFWDAVVELTRALNAWQYKTIEEMGDDGMLDPAEKATLRQIFTDMVKGWYVDSREAFSIISVLPTSGEGITQQKLSTASSQLRYAIEAIGSYMAGYEPTPDDEDNPSSWSYSTYGWVITSAMEEGLVDPVSGSTATNLYPLWLQKEHDSESNLVKDNIWDYFWKDYAIKRDALTEYLSQARQYQIDHIDVELQETFYIDTLTDPPGLPTPPYKVGDHMYRITQLTNPVTGETSTSDNDGIFYDHYICINDRSAGSSAREDDWQLLSAVQRHMMSADAQMIYQTIFNSNSSSSIVQRVNSITSTVSITEGGKNKIVNSDYADGTNRFVAYTATGYATTLTISSTTDLPTNVPRAMQVVSSGSTGGGIQLTSSSDYQPNLMLANGKKYTFSFYAKVTTASSTPTVKVLRNTATMLSSTELTSSWERYSCTVTGDGYGREIRLIFASNTTVLVAGMQLEEGETETFWQLGSDTKYNLQSQITQNATNINLSVKADGVTRSGLTLNSNGTMEIDASKLTISGTMENDVTINGDCLHIENDLDIKGLTTENVTVVERNPAKPTVINMGIVDSEDGSGATKIKSVQVKAVNKTYSADNVERSHLVVLPFYDSLVGQSGSTLWPNKSDNFIYFDTVNYSQTSPLYGSFMLYDNSDVNASERRVVPWKQAGTRVTVTNEVDYYCANWKTLAERVYDSNTGNIRWRYSSQNTREALSKWLLNRSVIVCSDPRIVCEENVKYYSANSPQPFIGTYGVVSGRRGVTSAGNDDKCKSGYFSCRGYMARFIVLLPGQTLQLRSQIMRLSDSSPVRDVLVWVVENEESFELMHEGTQYFLDGMVDNRYFSIALKSEKDSDSYYVGLYPSDVALDQNDDHPTKKDGILGSAAANFFSGNNNRYEGIAFSLGTNS